MKSSTRPDLIIHTKTREEYDALISKLDVCGYKWAYGASMKAGPRAFDSFKEKTCLRVEMEDGVLYGNSDFYLSNNYDVLSFEDFMRLEGAKQTAIHVESKAQFFELLQTLQENGWKWSGSPQDPIFDGVVSFYDNQKNITICLERTSGGHKRLTYAGLHYFKQDLDKYNILPFDIYMGKHIGNLNAKVISAIRSITCGK